MTYFWYIGRTDMIPPATVISLTMFQAIFKVKPGPYMTLMTEWEGGFQWNVPYLSPDVPITEATGPDLLTLV